VLTEPARPAGATTLVQCLLGWPREDALRGRKSRAIRDLLRLRNVRLKAEVLDADGSVIEEAFGWVLGDLELKATGLSFQGSRT